MTDFKWDKDKHHTWYNQWDYKTPRSYRERYGVDYKYDNAYEEEKLTHRLFIVLVCLVVIGIVGAKWL